MAACTGSRHYLDRHELARLVRVYQETGQVVEDLGRALLAIAGGLWDRDRYSDDKEEFCQEAALHLMGNPLKKCNTSMHVFNYFTKCVHRFGKRIRDKATGERRRRRVYAQHLVDSRVPIPEIE